MAMHRVGQVSVTLPVEIDELNLSILNLGDEGIGLIVAKAVKHCLECVFLGVQFDTTDPSAEVVFDVIPLNCPCGGCVGVQTCSED